MTGPAIFVSIHSRAGLIHGVRDLGADFAYIDLQHGRFEDAPLAPLIRAIRDETGTCFARVPRASLGRAGELVDQGVSGFIFPDIGTIEDLEQAARATADAVPPSAVIAMIESQRGAENVRAIAGSRLAGTIVVGCSDLLADLRSLGQNDPNYFRDLVSATLDGVRSLRCKTGIFGLGGRLQSLTLYRDLRPDCLSLGSEVAAYRRELKANVRFVHRLFAEA